MKHVVDQLACPLIRMPIAFPNAREAFELAKQNGDEGIMLKRLDAAYEPGVESWAWQKVKVIKDVDVIITDCNSKPTQWTVRPGHVGKDGVLYPEGKHSEPWSKGYVGLSYGFWDPTRDFPGPVRYGSLGITGPKEEMQKHIGRVAKIKVYGIEASGRLRHPVLLEFRDDKRQEECLAPRRK